MQIRYVLLCCVLLAPACGGSADRATEPLEVGIEDQLPDEEPQGRLLTGDRVGFREGWVNTFVRASGAPISNVRVDRAELWGVAADSTPLHGSAFAGAKFHGQTEAGEALFTIEEIMPFPDYLVRPSVLANNPEDPERGPSTYLYRVSVQHATGDPIHPWAAPEALCAGDKEAAFAAPFRGSWRDLGARDLTASRFTLSCLGGVVAKCGVLWGYKPWVTLKHTDSWETTDVHQACVRAARADYCARGVSHTQPGTLIKIIDHLHPQVRLNDPKVVAPGRSFEAAYNSAGAKCLSHVRWLSMPDECYNDTVVPPYMTEQPDKTRVPNECNDEGEAQTLSDERGWNVRVFVSSHINGPPAP